jgi:hypothetical protein
MFFHITRTRLSSYHNQMSAELHYKDTFAGSASQTTTVTLAGETAVGPLAPHLTIEVAANLAGLVSYSGAYSSSTIDSVLVTTYPTVTIDPTVLTSHASNDDADFRDKTKDAMEGVNSGVSTLQGLFKSLDWTYATIVFTDLPVEAVTNVEFGTITATTLADCLADTVSAGGFQSNVQGSAPVNLFEQCLAAGKISSATLSNANSSGSAEFVTGDTVSIYVTYTLLKTRKFIPDSHVSNGGSATFTLGDVTIDGDGQEQQSEPYERIVRWKFKQT